MCCCILLAAAAGLRGCLFWNLVSCVFTLLLRLLLLLLPLVCLCKSLLQARDGQRGVLQQVWPLIWRQHLVRVHWLARGS